MPRDNLQISIQQGDVIDFACDVLVLKYAQWWHGADMAVASALEIRNGYSRGRDFVAPGEYKVIAGGDRIAARQVLFEGVPSLGKLNYSLIREFTRRALFHVNETFPEVKHIAMTMHGVNMGMDERESFLSQCAGLLEAVSDPNILLALERITIVERHPARAQRLSELLQKNYSPVPKTSIRDSMTAPVSNAGVAKNEKAHVFVAMPFSEEMEDVFIFGIQGPVQEAGLLCERVDMAVFTGDIVERIRTRIETATLVIADLSGANANVYLEVGYAWGCKVNTLLLCRDVKDLKFDVQGQRCVIYSSINDLRKRLTAELKVLVD